MERNDFIIATERNKNKWLKLAAYTSAVMGIILGVGSGLIAKFMQNYGACELSEQMAKTGFEFNFDK